MSQKEKDRKERGKGEREREREREQFTKSTCYYFAEYIRTSVLNGVSEADRANYMRAVLNAWFKYTRRNLILTIQDGEK